MYTYLFVLCAVIGGITLVESADCTCDPTVDKIPYQNVVCKADWVILFQWRGKIVPVGNFRMYTGKIIDAWKPRTPEKWVQEKLYARTINMKKKAVIYTDATCPVELKKKKTYILSGSLRFGELFISRCQSLVLPYEHKYKDYEDNFKTHFQDNCDCQVEWKEENCSSELVSDFVDKHQAGPDECIGTEGDRDCTNAIGYCSREKGGICEWKMGLEKGEDFDENNIPGDVNGKCHKEFCVRPRGLNLGQPGCHPEAMFWNC